MSPRDTIGNHEMDEVMSDDKFDCDTDDEDDAVVVPQQDAIEVYLNVSGYIVLHQQDRGHDHFITIQPHHAAAVAKAILKAAEG